MCHRSLCWLCKKRLARFGGGISCATLWFGTQVCSSIPCRTCVGPPPVILWEWPMLAPCVTPSEAAQSLRMMAFPLLLLLLTNSVRNGLDKRERIDLIMSTAIPLCVSFSFTTRVLPLDRLRWTPQLTHAQVHDKMLGCPSVLPFPS